MPQTPLLNTAEAASLLGRSVSTISRLVRDGELKPAMRVGGGPGGSMFFNRRDVEALAKKKAS